MIEASRTESNKLPNATHVILIHGTWARRAQWIQRGSKFLGVIERANVDNLSIESFEWSGWNSFKSRERASLSLARRVNAICRVDQSARIFLVGHSHGGNVLMQAYAESVNKSNIVGLVCMATPRYHARKRKLGFLIRVVAWSVHILLIGVVMSLSIQVLFAISGLIVIAIELFGIAASNTLAVWIMVVVAFPVASMAINFYERFVTPPIRRLIRHLHKRLAHHARTLAQRINWPALSTRVLLADVVADEVSRWFSVLSQCKFRIQKFSRVFSIAILVVSVCVVILGPFVSQSGQLQHPDTGSVIRAVSAASGIGVLLLLLKLLIQMTDVAANKALSASISMGRSPFVWSVLLIVGIEQLPPSGAAINRMTFAAKSTGLNHSAIYNDENFLECLRKFLESNATPLE